MGTQNGREVEIVNTFELMVVENDNDATEPRFHEFLVSRRDQCKCLSRLFLPIIYAEHKIRFQDKQVFPSLEFIGWYTVAPRPTFWHTMLHEQVYLNFPCLFITQCLSALIVHKILHNTTAINPATKSCADFKL